MDKFCPRCRETLDESLFNPKQNICSDCEHEHKMLQAHSTKNFKMQGDGTNRKAEWYHTNRVVTYGETITAILEQGFNDGER